ncbi:MAG: energy-coupling factor ABC transporter ATP-binding protein [Candidatus Hodarchaeota archaeon]
MSVIIKAEELSHTYPGNVEAIKNIDLEINAEEFVAIIGRNGSGKTTLVKHFNGLLKPTKGRVLVKGKDTSKCSIAELARIVGYSFQNPYHQVFEATVEEDIAFGPKNFQLPEEEVEKRVSEALKTVDLEKIRKSYVAALSRSQTQRLAIGGILAMKPEVIIFDEPTTGQDYTGSKSIMDLLQRLNEEGHTIIIITHTIWLVSQYARRTILVGNGEVIADGPTQEILSKPDLLARSRVHPPEITKLAQMFKDPRISHNIISAEEMAQNLRTLYYSEKK